MSPTTLLALPNTARRATDVQGGCRGVPRVVYLGSRVHGYYPCLTPRLLVLGLGPGPGSDSDSGSWTLDSGILDSGTLTSGTLES